jgi:GMP synthase (glutamine-hydrolysing)
VILTVIEHQASCPLDRFEAWLLDAAEVPLTIRTVRPWAGDALPEIVDAGDGLIVLGGETNAYDDAGTPWLAGTRALMAEAVATRVPLLGICLGAQLLAVATGGRVQVAAPPGRESGIVDVHPRPDAATDPLLRALASRVAADHPLAGGVMLVMPSMHADAVVDLPSGAVWLASSRLYPYQAFRIGDVAWGLQFHPEASLETFRAWAEDYPEVDTDAVCAQFTDRAAEVEAGGRALAAAFVGVVAGTAAQRAGASAHSVTAGGLMRSSASMIR